MPRRYNQPKFKYLARTIQSAIKEFDKEKEVSNTLRKRVIELEREKEEKETPIPPKEIVSG